MNPQLLAFVVGFGGVEWCSEHLFRGVERERLSISSIEERPHSARCRRAREVNMGRSAR